MTKILMNTIDLNAPTQLRQMGESMHHVMDLAFAYADTGTFIDQPWVAKVKGMEKLVPIDGFHRLHAIEWLSSDECKKLDDAPDVSHLDLTVVDVKFTEFDTIGEAIIAAAGVNSTHGMKRKAGDIRNSIAAILEVEPMMFMENKYKLNQRVIMATVNCSSASYRRETVGIRSDLVRARDFDIRKFHDEGKSQREIAAIVGTGLATVCRVLGTDEVASVPKCSVSEMEQEETVDVEGVQKTPVAQNVQEEETTSVFTHVTSVTPVENPWETKDVTTTTSKETPAVVPVTPEVSNTETSATILQMFNTLTQAEKDHLLVILTDNALEF